jgi:hypothetical protein
LRCPSFDNSRLVAKGRVIGGLEPLGAPLIAATALHGIFAGQSRRSLSRGPLYRILPRAEDQNTWIDREAVTLLLSWRCISLGDYQQVLAAMKPADQRR